MLRALVSQIDRYLVGDSSVRELEAWLVAHLQSILDSGDRRAVDLANQLDADLVELSERLIDEDGLRARLDARRRQSEAIDIGTAVVAKQRAHASSIQEGAANVCVVVGGTGSPRNVTLRADHVFA